MRCRALPIGREGPHYPLHSGALSVSGGSSSARCMCPPFPCFSSSSSSSSSSASGGGRSAISSFRRACCNIRCPSFCWRFPWRGGARVVSETNLPVTHRVTASVRVEPKTFFANERTLLQWMNSAVLISTIAISLLNFGTPTSRIAGLIMAPVALFFIIYSFVVSLYLCFCACSEYMHSKMYVRANRASYVCIALLSYQPMLCAEQA